MSDSDHVNDERAAINLDWVQLIAGALTAVTSAVLLSTVGVAGTLIGAAVGSVLGTVGNAVYSHYLRMSRRRVADAKALAEVKARDAAAQAAHAHGRAALGETGADLELVEAQEELREAQDELADAETRPQVSWRDVLSTLPWRRILAITGTVFVVAFGAILTFEAIAGRAVSTFTGGTEGPARISIPGIERDAQPSEPQQPGDEAPDPQPDDRQPSVPAPVPEPTEPVEPSEPAPSPTSDEVPTEPEPPMTGTPAPLPPSP